MKQELMSDNKFEYTESVVSEIKGLLNKSRNNIAVQVNNELLATYWKIGEIIVKYEQNEQIRAAYGEKTLVQLSKCLTKELGRGFSRSNLQNMRLFYLQYPICQTVSGKLSWSHYCELLSVSDMDKRHFYEKECVNSGWSVRELKRQIESSLFERLLYQKGMQIRKRFWSWQREGLSTQNRRI